MHVSSKKIYLLCQCAFDMETTAKFLFKYRAVIIQFHRKLFSFKMYVNTKKYDCTLIQQPFFLKNLSAGDLNSIEQL